MTRRLLTAIVCALALTTTLAHGADALPSWNEGKAKQSIVNFVAKVTQPGSNDFVPVAERIATFDNDGCLWAEQPMYFQALFIFDRIKALASQHPEWKEKEPFASVLKDDLKTALAGGEYFFDDKGGKPVAINQHIGRHPIAAFGNSDGDRQMLQWTCLADGPRFCLYVHHTDSEREWAYDRPSSIGRFDKGWTRPAPAAGPS